MLPRNLLQPDNQGLSVLHHAIRAADREAIFFMIQIGVDMNTRIQDSEELTPLHLAVLTGVPEDIMRSLVRIYSLDYSTKSPLFSGFSGRL
ncbi:unnamed protein product [Protopolystoma xenopodis]|uniref:Uncharacterized protein n=1 Tax=Protopolystoma xenopodis TaxID=117903 RepID=A0A448WG84_9PLAT|nr:unnamed protein product [Protopolystoma xenopodis]